MTGRLEGVLRTQLRRLFTGEGQVTLESSIPCLERCLQDTDEFGLYLHIPFCRQICPYCPYNKELYQPELAVRYAEAVLQEVARYAGLAGHRRVTSFYVGGGTPTTMLYSGLDRILNSIYKAFNMCCDIHMESHPNDLTQENLNAIVAMGVAHLSIGVEALHDHHLKALGRTYTVAQARSAVERAAGRFRCVNVDTMFGLPGQTCGEVEQTGRAVLGMGVDQVAAYPLFRFPYTRLGRDSDASNYAVSTVLERRKMLSVLENLFYGAGYERTSVWAFTRPGIQKYCSVTVPLYIGLGASGGSYLRDVFYLNTFSVAEYVRAIMDGRMPIALSLKLTEKMQMAGWLYWRIYETRIKRSEFKQRFGRDFDEVYALVVRLFGSLGFLKDDDGAEIVLSDRGAYWLHVLEDLFSVDYVGRLWGTSVRNPWPQTVTL